MQNAKENHQRAEPSRAIPLALKGPHSRRERSARHVKTSGGPQSTPAAVVFLYYYSFLRRTCGAD